MEVISSNSFPKFHPSFHVSSRQIDNPPPPTTHSNSLTKPFQHIRKLIIPPTDHHQQQVSSSKSPREHRFLSLANLFKCLDSLICTYIDSPLRPAIDAKHILSGHFAPVDELPPTPCELAEGALPSCLDGAYIRNGPNPQFVPRGPYHLFDGDGMIHCIRISQGKATFCSRYVKTYKYNVESKMGYHFVPSLFSTLSGNIAATTARILVTMGRVVTGQFDPFSNGFGAANTSVAVFARRLFAMVESDLPYAIKITCDGDITTLGRHDFHSQEPLFWMTAHPKIDQSTGEVFAYRYNVKPPFLTYFRISPEGRKQADVHIHSMKTLSVIHDFAITQNRAIFPDIQIVVNVIEVLRGRPLVGVDTNKVPRLGIIPKYAVDEREMRWIDVPGLNVLHTVNAWDEDGGSTIVMVGSNGSAIEQLAGGMENLHHSVQLHLEKIVINVEEKTVERHRLTSQALDFAVINPAYATKKNRYVYAPVIALEPPRIAGVVKLDLSLSGVEQSDCTVASCLYGPLCSGGEVFFVAKDANNHAAAEEDDGYLITFAFDEQTNESKFLVMDAKSPTLEIVAAVNLPQRVPLGFHGLFVSKSQLNQLL